MKNKSLAIIIILLLFSNLTYAQSSKDEAAVLQISKAKWQWMADKMWPN